MLIPLGTDRPLHRPTVVTYLLMGACIAVYLVQIVVGRFQPDLVRAWEQWGMVYGGGGWAGFRWWTLFTYQFLHGGFWHIAGNMLFLLVFGQCIEDRFGRVWFLVFYLLGGAAAGALHAVFDDHPAIGASGAIAACTGAFLVLFPRTHVRCFALLFVMGVVTIPAWWFIGFAIVWDMLLQGSSARTGTAHLAHLGGYGFGMAVSMALLGLKIIPREPYDLFTMGKQAYRRRQLKELTIQADRATAKKWERAKGDSAAAQESSALAESRAAVSRAMAAGDMPGAASQYKKLADSWAHISGAAVLSRKHQYDLANWFYQNGDTDAAAFAYARFLEGYPKDSEAGAVRLLLGIIHARSLNDPLKAKALINQAIGELRDPDALQMARKELEMLG